MAIGRLRRILTTIGVIVCVGGVGPATGLARAQGLGGAGTVQGTVKDPTGGVMAAVTVRISNPVSGFSREASTDAMGQFAFRNLPPNPYHLEVSAQGFQPLERDVEVRTSVPIDLDLSLGVAVPSTTVEVVGHAVDLLERDPTAHTDLDQSLVAKLPIEASGGLNQVVTLASPGVVADANGFFHSLGDHAQQQFSIDNQPVTDQQSRIYSNLLSPDAVESMEVITGVPPAEFGEKDSLVVRVITKSGLDQSRPSGSVSANYGSFKTPGLDFSLGGGTHEVGNFLSASGLRTDRYLDSPEFDPLHGEGNSLSFFDRFDLHPTAADAFHFNVQSGRSAFDVPNTYDQAAGGQAQHQDITSFNVAPGYTRILSGSALLAADAYVRRDHVTYAPSPDPFADETGSVSQNRYLTNIGAKVDVSWVGGVHNIKVGGSFSRTPLHEQFTLGLTDPTINAPCVDADGNPLDDTSLVSDAQCDDVTTFANPDFVADLVAYDLTRGGGLFSFDQKGTVNQQAFYVQDEIQAGNVSLKLGLRADHYDGFAKKSLAEPRLGLAYSIPQSGTILRASYGRTLETPFNENLVLTSSADAAIFGASGLPLPPGVRDQEEVGFQQALGRWVVVDLGYFHKHTTNAYDFGAVFDTPIFVPVSWDHSKITGVTGRINLVEHHGFSAFTVFGHTAAIYSPPGTGGLLSEAPEGDFRIDHDQKFQQTTNLQYTFSPALGAWAALSWRYDSGLVAGSVPDYATALGLSADQQAAIGLFCGGTVATLDAPITECSSADRGATRLVIPADGAADDVTNPPRIAPRHLFDLGLGIDNLVHTERAKVKLQLSVVNLTNKVALYNFLSTFAGTHFVTPRAYKVEVGVTF